jgi:hypothetical protein
VTELVEKCCDLPRSCHNTQCVYRTGWRAKNPDFAVAAQDAPSERVAPKPVNPKDGISATKLPLHLWPETASVLGSLALMEGMLKYGRLNWRGTEVRASVYVGALKRHLNEWMEGCDADAMSGLHPLAHALACLAIIVDAQAAGKLIDDRNYPGGYDALVREQTPHVARLVEMYADRDPPHHWTITDSAVAKPEPPMSGKDDIR